MNLRRMSNGEWINETADCRDRPVVWSAVKIHEFISCGLCAVLTSNRTGPIRVRI